MWSRLEQDGAIGLFMTMGFRYNGSQNFPWL
jgi:hypothetical protein